MKRRPNSNHECYCGRYRGIKFKDFECDLCGGKIKLPRDTKDNSEIIDRFLEVHANLPLWQIRMLLKHNIKMIEEVKYA